MKSQNQNQQPRYNTDIFTKIYQKNLWGGNKGEYFSGSGSHNPFIIGYIKVITDFILKNNVESIIEIGCGDFNVSYKLLNELEALSHHYTYTGYDVVKPLVAINRSRYAGPTINFVNKDACTGIIKSGDLLIIRQVLQHLNNKSIQQIVTKFSNYKYIIFSEHQADIKYDNIIVPNRDKITNESIRLESLSGVYLDKAPFNCQIHSKLHAIPERIFRLDAYINTFLIINKVS